MEDSATPTSATPSSTTTTEIPQNASIQSTSSPAQKVPRKRFVGKRTFEATRNNLSESTPAANSNIEDTSVQVASSSGRRPPRTLTQIPAHILNDPDIAAALTLLPPNYNFEIHKTIAAIHRHGSKRIGLQLPEGLLLFACTISDILTQFCPGIETVIMGDVTYGACCIDDYTARALGCDLLVHYAHSCLIPVDVTQIRTLYVFVTITIDTSHFVSTLSRNFTPGKTIAIVGTIQFNSTIHKVKADLTAAGFEIVIPQAMPLSKGEILGCTSPQLDEKKIDALLYLGDGRFHLESAMIQNPNIPSYRYDPYSRKFTREHYDHKEMHDLRLTAISQAKKATKWGLILGTLGRQGNPNTLVKIEEKLKALGLDYVVVLLSEIFPGKLARFTDVEAWVQVACPRLSIDWGYAFERPLLSPYEALIALGEREVWKGAYPMDFYAKDGLGRTKKVERVESGEVVEVKV
ncbi:diphthamide biosynthesis protein 1 [Ascobolus immersus RN42]|uniref:2-(3-amino-3-carboxypropyl)histidine synthase subunit 1 n=1 Tax=Ascobolus immersus RN42 TaxID=1160509 RepID=A0A3N4IMH1_ASCIM|nr:diphthamide biosynthesis protein 1 [Ascobolus immersus RN42]